MATPSRLRPCSAPPQGRYRRWTKPAAAPISVSAGSTGAYNLSLPPSGATVGSYTLASFTVDSFGRVLSASSGTVGSAIVAETIKVTGEATGSASITVSSDTFPLVLTLAAVCTAGTYSTVTVDAKGRTLSGTNPISTVTYLVT